MVNVAVWHKTDQKDELHPICRVRFTVADAGRPSFFFSSSSSFYLLDLFAWAHPFLRSSVRSARSCAAGWQGLLWLFLSDLPPLRLMSHFLWRGAKAAKTGGILHIAVLASLQSSAASQAKACWAFFFFFFDAFLYKPPAKIYEPN